MNKTPSGKSGADTRIDAVVLQFFQGFIGREPPSLGEVAQELDMSQRTASLSVRRLIEAGELRYRKGRGPGQWRAAEAIPDTEVHRHELTLALRELISEFRVNGDEYAATRLEAVMRRCTTTTPQSTSET